MYLFDTNALSEVMKKRPNHALIQRLSNVPGHLQFTSCICVMELRYGARRRVDHQTFWRRIETELLSLVAILPITEDTAILAGDIAAKLSLRGLGVSAEDLLIASTAIGASMTLVTANIRHFEKIPDLKFENWLAE